MIIKIALGWVIADSNWMFLCYVQKSCACGHFMLTSCSKKISHEKSCPIWLGLRDFRSCPCVISVGFMQGGPVRFSSESLLSKVCDQKKSKHERTAVKRRRRRRVQVWNTRLLVAMTLDTARQYDEEGLICLILFALKRPTH